MKTLIACGYSDDTILLSIGNRHYDRYVFEKTPLDVIVRAGDGACRIMFVYTGVWSVGISQVDEGVPLPEWAATATYYVDMNACEYSVRMSLQVPDDTTVDMGAE